MEIACREESKYSAYNVSPVSYGFTLQCIGGQQKLVKKLKCIGA